MSNTKILQKTPIRSTIKLPKETVLNLLEEMMDELEDIGNTLLCVLRGGSNETQADVDAVRRRYNSALCNFNELLNTFDDYPTD